MEGLTSIGELMNLRVLPLYTSSENLIPSPCLIRRTSLSMVKVSMSKWAFSRIVPPGVSYIPDETQRNTSLSFWMQLNIICNRLTPLWAQNDAFLSNTQKWYRQFSTIHLLILPEPNAPSSLSPSEAIHNSINGSSYATESSLIVLQLSWQTSPHRATDEAVLGKWQGRRPLPAWSPDQDSAYPAIYPLWTGGRVERRKDEVDDRRNEAINQVSAKTKGGQRKMLPVASDNPNRSFINDIHFS